jgi:hypothetical protein
VKCTKEKCLASVEWFGWPDDNNPALRQIADKAGWKLFEGRGWRCPAHQEGEPA